MLITHDLTSTPLLGRVLSFGWLGIAPLHSRAIAILQCERQPEIMIGLSVGLPE